MKQRPTVDIRLVFGAGLVIIAILAWRGTEFASRVFLAQTAARGGNTLTLSVAGLRGALSKYEPLPKLIAGDATLIRLLLEPDDEGLLERVNRHLETVSLITDASDIYLMDDTGLTIAASNHASPATFIGGNFAYRPYFQQAREGRLGRYFALGTTSLKRGYYFAYSVRLDGAILGVVAVKVGLDDIEKSWQGAGQEIVVTDANGIVFMSGRTEWLFRSMEPIDAAALGTIAVTRQYDIDAIAPLDVVGRQVSAAGDRLITLRAGAGSTRYLVQSQQMAEAGWTVHVLSDTNAARAQTLTSVAAAVLLALAGLLALVMVIQRRQRLRERMALQAEAREMLERRVDERTADLNDTNQLLVCEIAERNAAEEELRKTQDDLIQAGKLAALGQMSAALSHEFNQPLAAVRSYADNAGLLIEMGRTGEARENVERIAELTGRMASLSKHLNAFARAPRRKSGPVSLTAVITASLDLLAGRIAGAGAEIVREDAGEVWVRGGFVRLQQVVVNLISNALDATREARSPRIVIAVSRAEGRIVLAVRDNGPGVPADLRGRIFDPFFTTKGVGEGLGLGLSISYNIVRDFGGVLKVDDHEDGGAQFTIELDAVEAAAGAAAE
jgi:two-component system C4-dicarboxylate transport sensor histidine kinase DctB